MKSKNLTGGLVASLICTGCCLLTPEAETLANDIPCPDAEDPITVRGYYDLETCEIFFEVEQTECGWIEEGLTVTSCPGLRSFRLIPGDRTVELFSVLPLERSAQTLQIWYDESCPYPGDYDNGYSTDHYAIALLTKEHWECIQGWGGFRFLFRVY